MDKDYTIVNVQERKPWSGTYGMFNSFALQLEGVDGWIELSQMQKDKAGNDKPAPAVGTTIFGHIESSPSKDGQSTYFKFKKASANYSNNSGGASKEDMEYIKMMLEELTGRREMPDNPTAASTSHKDVILEDIDDKPIDLSEIPF